LGEAVDDSAWPTFVSAAAGVDILPAPETPYAGGVDPKHLHAVLEYARMNYDWVIIDLPVIFQRLSLMTISESDRAFLVSTSELPSLYLARKAVNLLDQLGFPKGRFQVILNRISWCDEIAGSDIEKLLDCTVHSRIPNDYVSLHRAVTLGQPVDENCELGKAMKSLAIRLSSNGANDRKKTGVAELKAVLPAA
jgi:pilus assembly protein CpaE